MELLRQLKEFGEHFGINHEQMKWEVSKLPDGIFMIAHKGDTICFGDPNHQDPDDQKRFDLIVQLANSVPNLIVLLEGLDRWAREYKEQTEPTIK